MKKKRCPVLSFKSRAEAWGESNQKLRSRGRSLLSRPFACISMNKVIYLVHQKKNRFTYQTLCRCPMKKKMYRIIVNENNRV